MFSMLQAHSGLTAFLRRPEVKRHLGFFLRPNLRRLGGVFGLVLVDDRAAADDAVPVPPRDRDAADRSGPRAVGAAVGGSRRRDRDRERRAQRRARPGEPEVGLRPDRRPAAALYDKFQRMPLSFFARANTGALLNRITNEVNAAENLLSSNAVAVMRSVLTLGGAAVVLAFVEPAAAGDLRAGGAVGVAHPARDTGRAGPRLRQLPVVIEVAHPRRAASQRVGRDHRQALRGPGGRAEGLRDARRHVPRLPDQHPIPADEPRQR